MWSTIKTPAIVLSTSPLREADRRYTALTPLSGKIEFVGRGAQKPRAKLAPHLEPFAVVDLEVVYGAHSTTVISAERLETFSTIGTTLEHRLLAHTLFALVDDAVKPDLNDEVMYLDVLEILRFLDARTALPPGRGALILGGFVLRFLRRLGYDIELSRCLACALPVMPLCFRWHSGRGGLVCSDCAAMHPEDWFAARALDEAAVTLMRFARDAEYAHLLRPALPGRVIAEFSACVDDVARYHIPGFRAVALWPDAGLLPPPANVV